MRKTRTCKGSRMNTNSSACSIDWKKARGAILTEHGVKLPADIAGEKLLELYRADRPGHTYSILPSLEYAKNGGEPQVSAVGHGIGEHNGLSTQTDTSTLKESGEVLNAQFPKYVSKGWDVYFRNQDNTSIGYNNDTDILAGIPISTAYPTVTRYPTNSAKSAMTVSFSHEDVEDSQLHFDYVQLDFNPKNFVKGLVGAVFQKLEAENTHGITEVAGGYDRTKRSDSLIANDAAGVMNNVTSAIYSDGIITTVPRAEAASSLKTPSVLYEKGIRGIEQVS